MKRLILPLAAFLFAGCASLPRGTTASGEVHWSGRVEVSGTKTFPRGTNLILEPGTTVVFKQVDSDGDGLGDSSILLEAGSLTALGTLGQPVVFTGESSAPGSWGELRLDFSRISLKYTVVEGSARGLHLHFASGSVGDSIFRSNLDATRLGESSIEFRRCLFSENTGKGYNARASANTVTDTWFRSNRRGLFLFEGDKGSRFSALRFSGNDIPVKLGDFYEGEVSVAGTLGDGSGPQATGPAGYLSDPSQKAQLDWREEPPVSAGPSGWPLLSPLWTHRMKGFVDADPVADERGAWFADWSGDVERLSLLTGETLAAASTGDTIDAAPALSGIGDPPLLAVQNWGRRVILLDPSTLKELDSFTEETSPADDHRQSAPIFVDGRLAAGTWAGALRFMDVGRRTLSGLWNLDAGSPIRAGLAYADGKILAGTEGGTLLAITQNSLEVWRADLGAPLLSTPAVSGGVVYVGAKDGKLSARSLSDGKPVWSAQLCGPAWYAPPLVEDGKVFQGDDGGCLTAFDAANGALLFRVRLDGALRSRPAAIGGSVLVTTLGGTLFLVDASTGFVRDRLSFGAPLQSSPFVLGNLVFFGGRDSYARGVRVFSAPSK